MIGLWLGDVLSLIDESETTCVVVALSPPRVLHDGDASPYDRVDELVS